ncbi:hypothetical protein ANCDUO_06494 [Ancylostoma duodenale]|uniref:Uncharacterized protein n=1 Tax=Ancylostoma duodenale TaxID=51022 RepID=A0A0C2H1B4_9BILA|nr:hypothetical protein ANCDUO_06494 [Ancylostoma duodenale]
MARAFEAIDNCPPEKQGFFGMRKSRSVETTQSRQPAKVETPSTLKHSMSHVEVEEAAAYATLPRGGRNPFKNMGSKLVERVRRSLSRSSRQSSECPETADPKVDKNSKTVILLLVLSYLNEVLFARHTGAQVGLILRERP